MKSITKYFILFITYGVIYYIIECLWKRQFSDYRMFLLGGLMGILIGLINNVFTFDTDIFLQMLMGSLLITLSEAIIGYQLNIVMQLNIWDYSTLPLTFVGGQINLIFSVLWMILSLIAIMLDDFLRMTFFKEEYPYYVFRGKVIYKYERK